MRDDRHRDLTNLIERAASVEALVELERATDGELTPDLRVMLAKRKQQLEKRIKGWANETLA